MSIQYPIMGFEPHKYHMLFLSKQSTAKAQWIRLPPWVRVPSTPSTLLSFIVNFVLPLPICQVKIMKINKKGRDWPIF